MPSPRDYIELRARSAFSFLEACSNPEDLVEAAAEQGHEILALADRDGVSGAPRFHKAARQAGLRALVGSTVSVGGVGAEEAEDAFEGAGGARVGRGDPLAEPDRVTLLCESPEGWRRLCRILTKAHGRRDKALEARDPRARNRIRVGWDELEAEAGHWSVLLRGDARIRPALLDRASRAFGDRLAVDVSHSLVRRTAQIARHSAEMA